MKPRAGVALIELVSTLALLGVVGAACVSLLRAQTLLLRFTSERAATAETLRTAQGILHAELRELVITDIRAFSRDSIAARVFRGLGLVCALDGEVAVLRYRGLREPDPSKDSLLIVTNERVTTFRTAAGRQQCMLQPDEQLVALTPADTVSVGDPVLVFETGAYHLASRALRYRRGAEGRQPVTDERIDDGRSRFDAAQNGVLVELHGQAGSSARAYVRFTNPR